MDLFLLHSWPKKDKKHYVLIVPILNQNSSFLLDTDNFSFTILKRLYHTSFKLNNVNFSRALPNGNPFNQLRGSQCAQTPSCILFPSSCKMQNFFPSWLMSCFVHQDFSVEVSNQKLLGKYSYQSVISTFLKSHFLLIVVPAIHF